MLYICLTLNWKFNEAQKNISFIFRICIKISIYSNIILIKTIKECYMNILDTKYLRRRLKVDKVSR